MDTLVKLFTQLGVNETFVTQFLIFVGSYFIISFIALRRLSVTLVERESRIEGREHEARKLQEEFSKIQAELQSSMKQIRTEANDVFVSLKNKALNEQKALITASRETAALEVKSVRTQVQGQVASEIKKLQTEIPQISKMILEQIMKTDSPNASTSRSAVRASEV